MMNYKALILGLVFFLFGQTVAWYQTNGQFISTWMKSNPFWVALVLGVPIGWSYILATQYTVEAFNGVLWPTRLLGFAMGILSFTALTYIHLNEGLTLKTLITLCLATAIVVIQVMWK